MSEPLIEGAQVPELEVLALQQQLNQRVRAGVLSGPLLRESGRLDEATVAKQREQEAADQIALAQLDPACPASPAERVAARAEDEALMAELQSHLAAIPDTPYLDFDHKGPSVARVQALAAAFTRKWATADRGPEGLGPPIDPGSLVWEDGAFDWPALEAALEALKRAEAAFEGEAPEAPERARRRADLAARRRQIVNGLQPGPASRRRAVPAAEAPAPPAPTRPLPASAAPSTGPLAGSTGGPTQPIGKPPAFVADPERERKGRELDILGPERRTALLREAAARGAEDPSLAPLAASLTRTHPELATPGLIGHFDAYACQEASQDEARLARIPPAARLGAIKALAGKPEEGPEALFVALSASLLKQHPQAAGEVLAQLPADRRGPLGCAMLARLSDEEIMRLGKEPLHQLARQLQAGSSAEGRRQLARVVRLLGRRSP